MAVRVGGLKPVVTTVRLALNPLLSAGCLYKLSGWFSGTELTFLLSLLCLSNSPLVWDTAVDFTCTSVVLFGLFGIFFLLSSATTV